MYLRSHFEYTFRSTKSCRVVRSMAYEENMNGKFVIIDIRTQIDFQLAKLEIHFNESVFRRKSLLTRTPCTESNNSVAKTDTKKNKFLYTSTKKMVSVWKTASDSVSTTTESKADVTFDSVYNFE